MVVFSVGFANPLGKTEEDKPWVGSFPRTMQLRGVRLLTNFPRLLWKMLRGWQKRLMTTV